MSLREHLNPSSKEYKDKRSANLLNLNRNISNNYITYTNPNNLDPINNVKNTYTNENYINTCSHKLTDKPSQIPILNNNFTSTVDKINININSNKIKDQFKNRNESNFNDYVKQTKQIQNLMEFKDDNPFQNNHNNAIDFKMEINKDLKEIDKCLDHSGSSNRSSNNSFDNYISFNFDFIDFKKLNYFKYLYHRIFCTKGLKKYQSIKKEIEHLLDFYVYCNYLKHQYLLNDPKELIE